MRGDPGSARFSASQCSGYGLASVRASSGEYADTCDVDARFSMPRHPLVVAVWGELVSDFIEGGACACAEEHGWLPDGLAKGDELLELSPVLLTLEGVYFRRRTTIRSLSHLSDSPDHGQAVRISDAQIAKLQQLLKLHFGLDYSAEEAQDAGRAILRFVGLKLYQQLERDRLQDTHADLRREP